jgi:hypothetical protein
MTILHNALEQKIPHKRILDIQALGQKNCDVKGITTFPM